MSVVGAAIGTVGQIAGQAMANRANVKLQQKQLDWNENMWHMNNEYNSPANQMGRMEEAGIHPMLALEGMGGGNSGAPAAGVSPAQVSNVMEGFDPVGQYMKLKSESKGIEQQESALKNDEVSRQKAWAEIFNLDLDAQTKQLMLDAYREDYSSNRILKKGEVELQGISILSGKLGLQGQSTENQIKILQRNQASVTLQYAEFREQMSLIQGRAAVMNLRSRTKMTDYELQYIKDNGWRIPNKVVPGLFGKIMGLDKGATGWLQNILEGATGISYKGNTWQNNFGDDAQPGDRSWGGVPYIPSEEQKINNR